MDTSARSLEVARLDNYLEEGGNASGGAVRIPRAHLSGGAAGGHESYDSMSMASSEYTIKEEIERKVGASLKHECL